MADYVSSRVDTKITDYVNEPSSSHTGTLTLITEYVRKRLTIIRVETESVLRIYFAQRNKKKRLA